MDSMAARRPIQFDSDARYMAWDTASLYQYRYAVWPMFAKSSAQNDTREHTRAPRTRATRPPTGGHRPYAVRRQRGRAQANP